MIKKLFLFLFISFLFVGNSYADLSHWAGEEIGVDISHWMGEEIGVDIDTLAGETVGAAVDPSLTWVGSNSNSVENSTDISVTHGLSIQSGDLVFAIVHGNGGNSLADNNPGYTFTETDEDYFNSEVRALYWRVAGGTEPAAYAFTMSSNNRLDCVIFVLRPPSGYSVQSPPYDVTPATVSTGTGTAVQAAAQTVGEANCAVIAVAYIDGAETFSAGPSGWTEGETIETWQPISVYYKTGQGTGSTGTADWTLAGSQSWGAEIFTLKPGEAIP